MQQQSVLGLGWRTYSKSGPETPARRHFPSLGEEEEEEQRRKDGGEEWRKKGWQGLLAKREDAGEECLAGGSLTAGEETETGGG